MNLRDRVAARIPKTWEWDGEYRVADEIVDIIYDELTSEAAVEAAGDAISRDVGERDWYDPAAVVALRAITAALAAAGIAQGATDAE